ncbi:MAG: AAA family ATPase [Chloroflexi bacterium]|nr:AAA family ATPase [Chloroflexota bacterium]
MTTQLSRDLAAYIPVSLARRILDGDSLQPGQSRDVQAAALFSDISGFTAMSEELASDGPRGAEELNRVLLLTFTGMIDIIHEMGGAINHFHGDAMSVYFPDEDGQAARRALACAQMMQRLMLTSLSRVVVNRPPGKTPFFDLTMKIGVGYGRCRETIIGDSTGNMEYALAGTAVNRAAVAEQQAQAGEVIACRAVLEQAGLAAADDFNLLTQPLDPLGPAPILDWKAYDDTALAQLATAVIPFIPPAIYERTVSGLSEMAEHRPAASIFVQFEFADQSNVGDAQLQAYFQWTNQVVSRFGGQNARLNRVLTGDKGNQLHIIFGAPVAPDAPEQAVRCALALQRERPAFVAWQRIGLAAGKVFACPVGAEKRREYTIVGDVVNLSARLTQVCPDGQVLTDKVTADRVRQWIEFEELSPKRLKGKQAKVALYRPLGDRSAGDQEAQANLQVFVNRWQRPLVGREPELDLLLGGMEVSLHGMGGAVAIFGPTGVGKTSLLAAGVKYWLDAGGAALAGEGQQHTNDIPFGPWRSVWRDFLGLTPGMDVDEQVTAVVNRVLALVPDCGDDVGLWGDVLGLPIPQAENLTELTAEARQARFFNLARRAFQAAAANRPLLIVLEGLHWADQASLAFIDDLSAHQEEHAIFLALTFRPPSELSLETLNRPICTPIALSDLPPRYGRELLRHLVGAAELPSAVEQHLGLRGRDGLESPVNPLFLEEAVNVMMGLGVLRVNGRLLVDESLLSQMQIPDTIHGLLLARIDRLPVPSRDLLQVASVIGRQFSLEPLVSIAPETSRDVASDLLADLSAEEITQLMQADPEWLYLFQHAMTHEVAYESLPFARRQILHAAVADWLVNRHSDNLKPFYAVLAYHYSRADDHENGLRFALAGAGSARDLFANREAVDLYTLAEEHLLALGEEERWETAVDLYLARGEALRWIGDFTQAIVDAQRAERQAKAHGATRGMIQAYSFLAELKYRQAKFAETETLTAVVIDKFKEEASDNELARAYQWRGNAAAATGRHDDALDYLNRAQTLCLTSQNNNRLARVLEAVAFVYYIQKKLAQAQEAMQESITLSRYVSNPANIASSLSNLALIQFQLGQALDALTSLNEAISLAEDTSRNFLAQFIGNKAEILAYLGKFGEAFAGFNDAINMFMTMDDQQGLLEVYLLMGYEYHLPLGQYREAQELFSQAKELLNTSSFDPEIQARWLIGVAQIELHDGDLPRAEVLLDEAQGQITQNDLSWWYPTVLYFRGLCKIQLNEFADAQKIFQQAMATVSKGGNPDYLPLIVFELARLNSDDESKYLFYLEQCVQFAQERGRFLDRVRCLRQAGQKLVNHPDGQIRQLGKNCLQEAEVMQQKQKKQKKPQEE